MRKQGRLRRNLTPHFFASSYLKRRKISASTLFEHQEKEWKRKKAEKIEQQNKKEEEHRKNMGGT